MNASESWADNMSLFDTWCDFNEEVVDSPTPKKKHLWKYTEKSGGRAAIKVRLCEKARSHYDSLESIADTVARLGYEGAAAILRNRLPQTPKARSGELGEIIATELAEEKMGFNVPVRRLRYKDGREAALRGDDFIGIGFDSNDRLWLLKGESKSRAALSKTTIEEARAILNRDAGRPTPISLLFIADRLIERGGEEKELGQTLQDEVAKNALPPSRIDHALFTLSGNAPPQHLKDDLNAADTGRRHKVINLRITDHQAFIKEIYDGIEELGDD